MSTCCDCPSPTRLQQNSLIPTSKLPFSFILFITSSQARLGNTHGDNQGLAEQPHQHLYNRGRRLLPCVFARMHTPLYCVCQLLCALQLKCISTFTSFKCTINIIPSFYLIGSPCTYHSNDCSIAVCLENPCCQPLLCAAIFCFSFCVAYKTTAQLLRHPLLQQKVVQTLRCGPLDLWFKHFPLLGNEMFYVLMVPYLLWFGPNNGGTVRCNLSQTNNLLKEGIGPN